MQDRISEAADIAALARATIQGGTEQEPRIGARRIKKIPPDLRRRRFRPAAAMPWYRRIALRLKYDSQFLRTTAQMTFALLCVWIGVEYFLFMKWGLSNGESAYVPRPPGADGFLPISALISVKYWLQTGMISHVHPAGLYIFAAIVAVSVLLKKSFCSWLCPIGTLSESLWMLGRKIFGGNLALPRWLDYALRSLKYLLLLFFLWSIGGMDLPDIKTFIFSPYNKVADVKMYLFFAQISGFAFWTLATLILLSVVIRNFWCRFLCPYGALLGIVGWLSPFKITRNATTCVDCALCTKACPANIAVHLAQRVRSDECTNCLACVEVCPVKDTLDVRLPAKAGRIPTWAFGALVVGVFAAVTGLAMLTGNWQSSVSPDEYRARIQQIDEPIYQHFRGKVPHYGPND